MLVKKSRLEEEKIKIEALKKEIKKLKKENNKNKLKIKIIEEDNTSLNLKLNRRDDFFKSIGICKDKYFNENNMYDLWSNRAKNILEHYIKESIKRFYEPDLKLENLNQLSSIPFYDKDKIAKYLNNEIECDSDLKVFFDSLEYIKTNNFLLNDKIKNL